MTAICALSETNKVMTGMVDSPGGGMHLDPLCLPLHLCSLLIFAVLYITFGRDGRPKEMWIDFTAVMGTLGSFCAIMIPTNGTVSYHALCLSVLCVPCGAHVVFFVSDPLRAGKAGQP